MKTEDERENHIIITQKNVSKKTELLYTVCTPKLLNLHTSFTRT